MVRESLARRFRPAGFEQPEGSRKNYVKPRVELQEAFDGWVGGLTEQGPDSYLDDQYRRACELVKPIGEIPYREANSLLAGFRPKIDYQSRLGSAQSRAGLFISACYNQSTEPVVIFNLDAPEITLIGYMLGKNKVLVNNGEIRSYLAPVSSGLIVNNKEAGNFLGRDSSGVVVNNGHTGGWFIDSESPGIFIDLQKPSSLEQIVKGGRFLRSEHFHKIPDLKKYFEELCEATRTIKDEDSAKRFLEIYGPEPRERIEQDIDKILKRELGYWNRMKRGIGYILKNGGFTF